MKSQKGVTLTSLAIYVIMLIVITGILAIIISNYENNIRNIYKDGVNNSEIDKFNLYFLKEVKKQGNGINSISDNEIIFTTGNKYTFKDDNAIYLNDNIKIAENIETCIFSSEDLENGKTVIGVTIKAEDGEEITTEYVLNNKSYFPTYENEEDYVQQESNTETNTTNNI